MCGVNRRKNLQVLFRLGLCSLSPFPVLLNAATGKENAYFPNYVDVASLAGLTAKTVVAGHESKDFLVSTTGGEKWISYAVFCLKKKNAPSVRDARAPSAGG